MTLIPPKSLLGKLDPEPVFLPIPRRFYGGAARHAVPMHINDARRVCAEYNLFAADWNERELGDNLWIDVWDQRERERRQESNWRVGRLPNHFRSCWGDVCWHGRFPRSTLGWLDYVEERYAVIRFEGFRRYDLQTGLRPLADWNKVIWGGWVS